MDSYRYLVQEKDEYSDLVDRIDDAATYLETAAAFGKMGFSHEETLNVFRIISGILHLGNVEFRPTRDDEASAVSNPHTVEIVSELLGVSASILEYSLCNRSIESGKSTKGSVISVQLNVQKASETRDTLARQIYDKLFQEIIINLNIKIQDDTRSRGNSDRCIGLLDIFGFEIFDENSFEQLCINYCNEMLQHHFNYVVFTAERQLYSVECINCDTIEFRDNSGVMKEIEGMFKGLDEEGRIPKGSSKTWFDKMKRGAKMQYVEFPNTRRKNGVFVVTHYAGSVDYNPLGMLEKNIETVNNDLVGAMLSSSDPVIQRAFAEPLPAPGSNPSSKTPRMDSTDPSPRKSFTALSGTNLLAGGGNSLGASGSGHNLRSVSGDGGAGGGGLRSKGKASSLASKSISWKFQHQLQDLMSMLRKVSWCNLLLFISEMYAGELV